MRVNRFILSLLFAITFFSSKAQEGFKYRIIDQYERSYQYTSWSRWADSSHLIKGDYFVYMGSDKITFVTPGETNVYGVTGQKEPTVSNSALYYTSYECYDYKMYLCSISLMFLLNYGREIVLIVCYPTHEYRYSLKVINN